MTESNPLEPVEVVVRDRAGRVVVTHRGVVHQGRFNDHNAMDEQAFEVFDVTGDESLLRAALTAWADTDRFTLTYQELADQGGGWLPQPGYNDDGTPLA